MSLDAVGLEVMGHAFASIAEEMGLVLIHSAVSPNIRERRDCSAALFDAAGAMIAQAAHIPVHLGALHESVAAVRALAPAPGDVFILTPTRADRTSRTSRSSEPWRWTGRWVATAWCGRTIPT